MQLAHSRWGEKKSATAKLILLHGMGGTGAIWRPLAAALENDIDILAPDQRGHGKSRIAHDIPQTSVSYTPLDYGRDLIETMDALQYHPAWVLGHSMGVRTAAAAAHLRPDWVQGLILIDLGFSGPAGGGLGDGLGRFLKILPDHFASRAEARAFMAEHCPDPSIAQYLMAVSQPSSSGGLIFPFDRGALIETLFATRDVSIRGWMHECGQRGLPVLVLRGASSLVWSRDEFLAEQKTFSSYPSIQWKEIPGTGHGLPFEKRMELSRMIRERVAPHTTST